MTKRRLKKLNAFRRKCGKPPLSGDRWGIKLCPSEGPIQSSIPKTTVVSVKRPVKRREEKIARLLDSERFTNRNGTSLWVEKNNRPLDRKFMGYSLRELQAVKPSDATPAMLHAMEEWMIR